ncbi:MAG: hypothetical protein R3B47_14140 [Bacteroidia bacterium]
MQQIQAQPVMDSALLAPFCHSFQIGEDGQFREGAVLLEQLGKNRSFVLKEYHGSAGIADFTKAMLPRLQNTVTGILPWRWALASGVLTEG